MDTLVFWATLSLIVRYFKSFSLFLRNCDQVAPICSRIFFFLTYSGLQLFIQKCCLQKTPFPAACFLILPVLLSKSALIK